MYAEIIDKKGIFLPPEIGGRGMIQNSFGPRTCPILTLTGSPSFLVINQVAKVDCRPEETAEGRDKASLIKIQVQESRQRNGIERRPLWTCSRRQ